jgi:hypothetical protein
MAADLGRVGRGMFREVFIGINLWIGYMIVPGERAKKHFVNLGIALEIFFVALVSVYATLINPPHLLMQLQVMLRELLLSPMYFFVFYMIQVKYKVRG